MTVKVKAILIREIIIFATFMIIGNLFELMYSVQYKGLAAPALPFWKDPYFYQFWNNSFRENGQIIKFLGYPVYLLIRLSIWSLSGGVKFIGQGIKNYIYAGNKIKPGKYGEEKVREILEEIAYEIHLGKKIESVTYRPKHSWFVIRFDSPPSCIIPQNLIEQYIGRQDEELKKEIINLLLS